MTSDRNHQLQILSEELGQYRHLQTERAWCISIFFVSALGVTAFYSQADFKGVPHALAMAPAIGLLVLNFIGFCFNFRLAKQIGSAERRIRTISLRFSSGATLGLGESNFLRMRWSLPIFYLFLLLIGVWLVIELNFWIRTYPTSPETNIAERASMCQRAGQRHPTLGLSYDIAHLGPQSCTVITSGGDIRTLEYP